MWIIKSKKSVGPLSIGENAKKLALELESTYATFKRVPEAEDTIFVINDKNVHLTCDYDERVKIISVFRPNEVTYSSIQLLGRKIEEVRDELNFKDIVTVEEDVGLWIEEAGVLLVEVSGIVDGIELYAE
jgi:hypothetical protein